MPEPDFDPMTTTIMETIQRWRERYFWWCFQRMIHRQIAALCRLTDAMTVSAASVSAFNAAMNAI